MSNCLYNRDLVCNNICCMTECEDNPNSKIKIFMEYMKGREHLFSEYENQYEKGYYDSIKDVNEKISRILK